MHRECAFAGVKSGKLALLARQAGPEKGPSWSYPGLTGPDSYATLARYRADERARIGVSGAYRFFRDAIACGREFQREFQRRRSEKVSAIFCRTGWPVILRYESGPRRGGSALQVMLTYTA
jgi:hypothetical protein